MQDYLNSKLMSRRRALLGGGIALSAASVTMGSTSALAAVARVRTVNLASAESRSSIDPTTCQVIFIDMQTSLVATSATAEPAAISLSSGVMARVADLLKMPISFSVVPEGENPPTLLDSLKPYSTRQNTLLRKLAGALTDSKTATAVAKNKRKKLIVAGFVAEVAVLQTVIDAIAEGYQVFYLVDCIGSQSQRAESAAFRAMEQIGAVPTSVVSLIARLTPDFYSSPGKEAFTALQLLFKK